MVFMLSTYPYCETAHYSVLFGQQHKHYQPLPNMCGFQCHPLGVLLWAKNNECREKTLLPRTLMVLAIFILSQLCPAYDIIIDVWQKRTLNEWYEGKMPIHFD